MLAFARRTTWNRVVSGFRSYIERHLSDMARRMPQLQALFATETDRALGLAEAGERIRAVSHSGSVGRTELSISRLEAMYEMAFLRIFLLWEDFLEQSFLRYLCGYASSTGVASLVNP